MASTVASTCRRRKNLARDASLLPICRAPRGVCTSLTKNLTCSSFFQEIISDLVRHANSGIINLEIPGVASNKQTDLSKDRFLYLPRFDRLGGQLGCSCRTALSRAISHSARNFRWYTTASTSRSLQAPNAGWLRKSNFRGRRFGRNIATARRTVSAREMPYFFP